MPRNSISPSKGLVMPEVWVAGNLLSLGDNAVRDLVRVRLALAALLAFGPAAQLGVGSGCAGLGSGRLLTAFTARLGGQFAAVGCPLVTTIRAFHCP